MFARPAANDQLTQGDLIDDCPLVALNTESSPIDLNDPPTKWWRARVIVLTQACDLALAKGDSVLVAPVHEAQELIDAGVLKGPLIRDQMRRHLVYGWYFLPAAPDSLPVAESLIDLRDVFALEVGLREMCQRVHRRANSPHHVVAPPSRAKPAEQLSHARPRLVAAV
jgi:hypothetical protein